MFEPMVGKHTNEIYEIKSGWEREEDLDIILNTPLRINNFFCNNLPSI